MLIGRHPKSSAGSAFMEQPFEGVSGNMDEGTGEKMNLKDAVVIVTGGGTGIGRATALLFAEHGARVVVCGRRPEPLTETVRLIKQRGGNALAVLTDVRERGQVMGMVSSALEHFGKVDILINNAGVAILKDIVETTEEEWDNILDTNLKGIFLCCKAVLPNMVEACNGVIVNVSSILGKTGIANMGAYCASKFGIIGITQALADEFKQRGIRIYAVCPGSTYTDLHCRIVGEEVAKMAAPPDQVAAKIIGLITGEVRLPSGGAIEVDEQSARLALNEAKDKWQQVARRWLKPALPMLRKVRNLIR
jgi:NAD(P)-dependent dehydrogenase (short-subunit alcohol dehydrogenase family)